jgi:hypothetical protein
MSSDHVFYSVLGRIFWIPVVLVEMFDVMRRSARTKSTGYNFVSVSQHIRYND